MSYNCKILLDSISETGKRLTTFELTFPRIILSEFNTHRMFSRNSASSRAIPFNKQLERVNNNPFIPEKWPVNGKGMQPNMYLDGPDDIAYANEIWLNIKNSMINEAQGLYDLFKNFGEEEVHIHKQIVNRLLEPFMWHTIIVTATEFDNFFKLRCDENAQYEIRRIADLMYEAYHAYDEKDYSEISNGLNGEWSAIRPQKLKIGEWHCPLISETHEEVLKWVYDEENFTRLNLGGRFNYQPYNQGMMPLRKMISVARCARVSYLTHDGKRDIEKDLELFERLRTSGHYSPFEHIATPSFSKVSNEFAEKNEFENLRNANFIGWRQMRQDLANENCTHFRKQGK